MTKVADPEPVGNEFWIILSDIGTPIVTNGRPGKQRIFLECENMEQAENLIAELEQNSHQDEQSETVIVPDRRLTPHNSRIMYIERKAGNLIGTARIGLVTYSKSLRTIYYRGKAFRSLNGAGFKSNYYDAETGEEYWISGCKRDGSDRLYGERIPVEIDEEIREKYWTEIRKQPEFRHRACSNM